MARTILLSRSWNISTQDAERIASSLGITGLRFVTLGRRSPRTPTGPAARIRDGRGARFLAGERRSAV